MMSDFAQTSLSWRCQQVQQRFGEWLEGVLRGRDPALDAPEPPPLSILDWLASPLWQGLAKVLAWSIVLAIASWLVLTLWQWLQPYTVRSPARGRRRPPPRPQAQQRRSPARWLASAQTYQRQGDYRRACLCLYAGMLQQLNDAKLVPQLASRTDGEYARAVANLPQAAPCRVLLHAHEELRFGDAAATVERYAECRDAFQQL